MPSPFFDESLIDRKTPWAACAAFEESSPQAMSGHGPIQINWDGVAFTCARKAMEACDQEDDMLLALGWAHLALAIRESLAASTVGDTWGIIHGAMVLRANLIIRYGNVPNDRICDVSGIIDWCFERSEVVRLLERTEPPGFDLLDPEVKQVAEILERLARGNQLRVEGRIAQFMDGLAASKRAN